LRSLQAYLGGNCDLRTSPLAAEVHSLVGNLLGGAKPGNADDVDPEVAWRDQRAICLSAGKVLRNTMAFGEALAKKAAKAKQDVIDAELESKENAERLEQVRNDHDKAHSTLKAMVQPAAFEARPQSKGAPPVPQLPSAWDLVGHLTKMLDAKATEAMKT
jgi:hypothetical protein